jgi:hypothetical protein
LAAGHEGGGFVERGARGDFGGGVGQVRLAESSGAEVAGVEDAVEGGAEHFVAGGAGGEDLLPDQVWTVTQEWPSRRRSRVCWLRLSGRREDVTRKIEPSAAEPRATSVTRWARLR